MRRLVVAALAAGIVPLSYGAEAAAARPTCEGKPATRVGTAGNDVIRLRGGGHVVVARGGNDRVIGANGRSRVCGGPGADVLTGGSGADRLLGGPGNDRIHGEIQDDSLLGGSGNDLLTGGHGIDDLRGGQGDDWLRGDDGTDRYDGGSGNDWISVASATPPGPNKLFEDGVFVLLDGKGRYGITVGDGAPERIFRIESVLGSAFEDMIRGPKNGRTVRGVADLDDKCKFFDVIECGADPRSGDEAIAFVQPSGPETGLIILGAATPDRWRIRAQPSGVRISTDTPLAAGPGCTASGAGLNCSVGSDLGYVVAWGDAGSDQISFESRFSGQVYAKLDGGPGTDRLTGAGGSDNLFAGESGNDLLTGGGGDDSLVSRLDSDTLRAGRGADQLASSEPCGRHVLDGGPGGPDVAGFGHVRPATHADLGVTARLNGRAREQGIDDCRPSRIRRSEVLEGTEGNDILLGTAGSDPLILGRSGNDLIRGLGGSDLLDGGPGRDRLFGGPGRDHLRGGSGKNTVRQ